MAKSFWKSWCADIRMDRGGFDYNHISSNVGSDVAEHLFTLSNSDAVVDAFTTEAMYLGGNHSDLVERAGQYGIQFSPYAPALGALMVGIHPALDTMIQGCNGYIAWPILDEGDRFLVGVNTDQLRNGRDNARCAVATVMELVALHNSGKCDLRTGRGVPTEEEMAERVSWLKVSFVGLI